MNGVLKFSKSHYTPSNEDNEISSRGTFVLVSFDSSLTLTIWDLFSREVNKSLRLPQLVLISHLRCQYPLQFLPVVAVIDPIYQGIGSTFAPI